MSDLAIVVPLRGVHIGKSRLAPVLGPDERSAIVASMAEHATGVALAACPESRVIVVTRDPDLDWLPVAADPRVSLVRQPDDVWGLNAAIELGREVAQSTGAGRLLVLPADLPLLEPGDLLALLDSRSDVTIATDEPGDGTNALLLGSVEAVARFPFQFGEGSRQRHEATASAADFAHETRRIAGLLHDLDTPDDWEVLSLPDRERLLAGSPIRISHTHAALLRETA